MQRSRDGDAAIEGICSRRFLRQDSRYRNVYIEPLTCPKCGFSRGPGASGFGSSSGPLGTTFNCDCGGKISLDPQSQRDQLVLSRGPFTRLQALANFRDGGTAPITPGVTTTIRLSQPVELLLKVFLTPYGRRPVAMKEIVVASDTIQVVSSISEGDDEARKIDRFGWSVYGLINVDSLPTWEIHFCGAVAQLYSGAYKSAVLDYSTTFEVFLEATLNERLSEMYGTEMATYLLKRTQRVEDRTRDLLRMLGVAFATHAAVYQPWDEGVRKLRNRLAHGDRTAIDYETAERAHDATYQAIRWIQDQLAAVSANGS